MSNPGSPELNDPDPGAILLVGRDYGANEERQGRPFVGKAGRLLGDCLTERGLRRRDVNITNVVNKRPTNNVFAAHSRADVERGIEDLHSLVRRLQPSVIVALGNEAAFALIPEWPSRSGDIFGAKDILDRRGYVFDGIVDDIPVLATVHPAAAARQWTPWRTLLSFDLGKAKEISKEVSEHGHLRRPQRAVEVVSSDRDARRALRELGQHRRLAADIEIYDERSISCVGFAGGGDRAFVFPAAYLSEARRLLEDDGITLIWQNGSFDLYYLLTRNEIRVQTALDDAMLAWHSAYPELAGKKVSGGGAKRTHKSLAFLASLFTTDRWWKDYEFADDHEMFVLNGRDCCVTYDVHVNHLEPLVDSLGVRDIYRHEVDLIWPVVEMQARGLRVDDELRCERIDALEARSADAHDRLQEIVIPLLRERAERVGEDIRLFEQIEGVCECCRHASKKQFACWSCAGFERKPTKKMLVEAAFANEIPGLPADDTVLNGSEEWNKVDWENLCLDVCEVCNGEPRREWLEFNEASTKQRAIVLYDLLRLPKRFNNGSLTTDEDALKGLLAYCQ